ncbi:hypothetical protein NA57DRAFT_39778 [Rhizodiscina lignyota]|uniref:Rab-GAP TBC domain-containing protein n=1 Tax=Rhizodiscina lignyota TaxID=1504668 RepID=A0A9P4IDU5_9PEZI|nr:hypothetical protein NA57DRAFT_39778 [Rhizodiscina lignyota]
MVPIRDLTNTSRPGYPSLKRQVNGAIGNNGRGTQSALHLPVSKSPRRGFTSPTNPHFSAPPLPPPSQRSRSPSPTFLQSFGINHKVPRRSSSRSSVHSTTSLAPIARRSSWQPGRKTVKELEDEYHDSDEDIPEDAVVWNVPLSPRPPQSRTESEVVGNECPVPPTPLTVPLPRTRSVPAADPQPQSGSIHSLRRQRSTPAILEDPEYGDLKPRPSPRTSPRPSRRPSPLSSVTDLTKLNQDIQAYGKARTKSYSEAMSDLSSDARHITAALEAFELQRAQSAETAGTSTSDVNTSSFAANTKVPTSTTTPISPDLSSTISRTANGRTVVTLPPLRKGDVMIDPLPISKEKEKVLTRTRPSWLPPKDQKEEKRHLREYRRMMEASLEAEKRRASRLAAEQDARDAAAASLLKIWEEYVLPEWPTALDEPRTRELWWRGVPVQHRGDIWLRAVGNELHLTETSYSAALKRANEDEARLDSLKGKTGESETLKEQDAERWAWFERMRSDVDSLAVEAEWTRFATPNAQNEQLKDVLMAYAFYRSDVGYVSGLHRLAALLLLYLPVANAFIVMANFLNRPVPMAYLLTTLPAISNTHSLILRTLAYKLPSLHAHLTSPAFALQPSEYLDPLLSSFYTDPRIGVERMSRMWDIMVFEGDKVLVRAAVAVLSRLENRLYSSREEILSILGWDSPLEWGEHLGDAEDWTLAMREAGKADKKED